MYSQVFGCIYLQCPALPQAVPGTALVCTQKPGYTYKKDKLSIYSQVLGYIYMQHFISSYGGVQF